MKSDKLFDEIGLISDAHINEAEDIVKLPAAKRVWVKWTSIAAAACLIIAAAFIAVPKYLEPDEPVKVLPDLPMLEISDSREAYGFEGHMAYDVSELSSGNPWTEDVLIETLPVFRNIEKHDNAGRLISGLSADAMIQKAEEIAAILGLTIDSVYTNPTEEELQRIWEKEYSTSGKEGYVPDETPYEAEAICGDVTIRAQANGAVRIFFENGVEVPDKYNFTYYDTTEEETADAMYYLLEQYEAVVDMTSPSLALFGSYNYYGQHSFNFAAYENTGSLTDQILGYNFNRVAFAPSEGGELWIIDRYAADLSQKIADYPIISAQEARDELLSEQYITTVGEEFPGEEYVASVELVYRTGRYDEMFIPYYRFFVELPTMQLDNGLKTFGAYYVPAVESQYISYVALWDGSFNK